MLADGCWIAGRREIFQPESHYRTPTRPFHLHFYVRSIPWDGEPGATVSMSDAESLALDTSGTWTPRNFSNRLITKQLEWWRRGESEYSAH